MTHPMPVRRVRMLLDWVHEGEYDAMVRGEYLRRGEEPAAREEADAASALLRRADRGRVPAGGLVGRRGGPAARRLAEAQPRAGRRRERRVAAPSPAGRSCAPAGSTRARARRPRSTRCGAARCGGPSAGGRSGRSRRSIRVDQHVVGALAALEAARGEHERLARAPPGGSARGPAAGTIRLIVPCSSSSSMNVTPLAVAGRWRATTRPATRTRRPCGWRSSSRARAQVAGQAGPHQLERVLAQRDPGRAVVGQHPLPGAQRAQLRGLVRVERQRELGPVRAPAMPGHGHAEHPERAPAPWPRSGPSTSASQAPAQASRPSVSAEAPEPPGEVAERAPRPPRPRSRDHRPDLAPPARRVT